MRFILAFFLIISTTCFSQQITRVEVLHVPVDVEPGYNVDCADYDFTFRNIINKKTISNTTEIERITHVLNNLPVANKDLYPIPDIRLKLRFFSGDIMVSEVCVGKSAVLKGGGVYLHTNDLLSLLDDLVSIQQESVVSQKVKGKAESVGAKQYKGFLGAAMGIISLDNENNFLYEIEGSTLKETLQGIFRIDGDIIECTIEESLHNLFEKNETIKFQIKSDTLFQFNSDNIPDTARPLIRIK